MSDRTMLGIQALYSELMDAWGPQHWWPAETEFEVIVGAYLTQNTAWTNVTRALGNLRNGGRLSVAAVREIGVEQLEQLIRPAGYFRQKAQRLKTFIRFLDENYHGDLAAMFAEDTAALRKQLLALNGVGPETADSILLYAGNHPVFVVDAYTRRIFERHGIVGADAEYEDIRQLVESALSRMPTEERSTGRRYQRRETCGAAHPPSPMSMASRTVRAQILNQMHALIVALGKNHCFKSLPDCEKCPLGRFLPGSAPEG